MEPRYFWVAKTWTCRHGGREKMKMETWGWGGRGEPNMIALYLKAQQWQRVNYSYMCNMGKHHRHKVKQKKPHTQKYSIYCVIQYIWNSKLLNDNRDPQTGEGADLNRTWKGTSRGAGNGLHHLKQHIIPLIKLVRHTRKFIKFTLAICSRCLKQVCLNKKGEKSN